MMDRLLKGRYRLIQVLGTGGTAQTYIAEDTHLPGSPRCVVKQLEAIAPDSNFLSTARNLFNTEAEILEQLGHHRSIPRLLAYFEQDQEFYLVQEFIEGHPLSSEMQPGQRFSEDAVLKLLLEVLNILDFVHSQGVIHRDIKPDNLIRQPNGRLVLIDFGAVQEVKKSLSTSSVTTGNMVIGTYGYMPTEQAYDKPVPNSDIYALGMVAIQALTGLMPVQLPEDRDTGEVLWQNFVEVSDELAAVLTKMVRYNFQDRYQTAAEVLQTLERLAYKSEPQAIATTIVHPSYSEQKPKRNNSLVRGLSIAGLVAAIAMMVKTLHVTSLQWFSPPLSLGGDAVLDVGVLTTKHNSPENYSALVEHLQSELGSKVEVKIHTIDTEEKNALEEARKKIKAQEWELAFTTGPLVSVAAVENGFAFVARMFPKAKQYESTLFVKADSPIQSLADINSKTTIALGEFNSAAGFYMPVYDLYGKTLQVDLHNSTYDIMNKVDLGEVDVGAGVYSLVKKNPNFRVISVSRGLPLAGVYLSPNLEEKEQDIIKKVLLNAPVEVREKAKYGEGEEVDYTNFMEITQRVEQITGCTNWQQNPVELFCDIVPKQHIPRNNDVVAGTVNGFKLPNADTIHVTVQGNDGKVYCVVLPREILDSDPNLPPLPAWNGKTIRVKQEAKPSFIFGTLVLKITETGRITILG